MKTLNRIVLILAVVATVAMTPFLSQGQNMPSSLQQGLVFYAPLSERYPNKDLVSGQTSTNTAVYNVPDRQGSGANRYFTLNGSSDYITLPTGITFGTSDFSVIMKVDFKELGRAQSLIGSQSFVLYVNSSNKLVSGKNNVGDNTASTTSITLGIHTIQYIRTGTSATYYIDGVADNTITDNRDYSTVLQWIGKLDNTYFLNASVYMARCFNYALSSVVNYSKPEYPIEWVDRGATGNNLVTNGTFDSGTGWSTDAGWTIGSGKATWVAADAPYNNGIQQNISFLTANKKYKMSYLIGDKYSFPQFEIYNFLNGIQGTILSTYEPSTGNYSFDFTSSYTGGIGIWGKKANGGTFSIDNVSLVQLGCVLDLNSSGLSRASDGSYNTGYWTDRTNQNSAQVVGATSVIPPASNLNATAFNGSSSYVPTNIDLTDYSSYTLSIWICRNGLPTEDISISQDGEGDRKLFISYDPTAISGHRTNVYNGVSQIYGDDVTTGTWDHIVVTNNATSFKLYQKGVLKSTGTGNGATSSSLFLKIGKRDYAGYPSWFSGYISNVQIWNKILDESQIKLLYDLGH